MSKASDDLEMGCEALLEPGPEEIAEYKSLWPKVVSHAKPKNPERPPKTKRYLVQSKFGYDVIMDERGGWEDYAQFHSLKRAQRVARRKENSTWYTEYRVLDRGPEFDRLRPSYYSQPMAAIEFDEERAFRERQD